MKVQRYRIEIGNIIKDDKIASQQQDMYRPFKDGYYENLEIYAQQKTINLLLLEAILKYLIQFVVLLPAKIWQKDEIKCITK